jgi:AraC family transcriptional regulator
MSKKEIRIVELPASKIVSFHGFGESPEGIAISSMLSWAEKYQSFQYKETRCFGFNNPDPTPGSTKYGYEVWLILPEKIEVEDQEVRFFKGGLYAVTHCEGMVDNAGDFIPSAWKKLMEWLENSPYQMGKHQWLEEQLPVEGLTIADMYKQGKISLDLYIPIKK